MRRVLRHRQGQMMGSEFAVLLMVAVVAVSSMTVFVRRAYDGRAKDMRDHMIRMAYIGSGNTMNVTREYEPYYTKSIARSVSTSEEDTKISEGAAHEKTTHSERVAIMNAYQMPPASAAGEVGGLVDDNLFK